VSAARALIFLIVVLFVAAFAIGGITGVGYLGFYAAALAPGWPIGRALFGRHHPIGWICGSLVGYALTSVILWLPIAVGVPSSVAFIAVWVALNIATRLLCRKTTAIVPLAVWGRDATLATTVVLIVAIVILTIPFRKVGLVDQEGGRRYKAYFTADFVWHEALTAELARFDSPPRNPYRASQPLHYYWAYFIVPSTVTGTMTSRGASPPIETFLAINDLGAGVLFVGTIFAAAWAAWPRAWPAAGGVLIALVAASAEGLYEVIDLTRKGLPLDLVRGINIDAVTSWYFYGLSVDGLPRSLWWGPQHASASALGLVALTIAARMGRQMTLPAAIASGTALGLALTMSPFPAGTMILAYAIAVLWDTIVHPGASLRVFRTQAAAVVGVGVGLAWCLYNGTFEGAGGAVAIGLSRAATRTPFTILGLALGPAIVSMIIGLGVVIRHRVPRSTRPALVGVVMAAAMFFFVTLVLEPIWIGWRAGHQFLVTVPALIAAGLAGLSDRLGRGTAIGLFALIAFAGLPTTIIDVYNAQDTDNLAMGPGFRWTVRLTPGDREALTWIEQHTPPDALVQMSLIPRGRETWTLIPTFARRRMAAGLPISLLHTPDYDELAAHSDRMYSTLDAGEAAAIARELKVEYIFVGRVEREAFGATVQKFADRPDLFGRVFANEAADVFVVL
jgi:hypothetical protein